MESRIERQMQKRPTFFCLETSHKASLARVLVTAQLYSWRFREDSDHRISSFRIIDDYPMLISAHILMLVVVSQMTAD